MRGLVIGAANRFVGASWIGAEGAAGSNQTIAANSAQGQSATVGTVVSEPPSVIVTDAGVPVQGVAVTFTLTAGGGTLNPASPVVINTDVNGIATLTSWTLGSTPGVDNNTVTASASVPTGSPVTFTASGIAVSVNVDEGQLYPRPDGRAKAASIWSLVGSASVPADNGTRTNASGPITVTPPPGMVIGDLVIAYGHRGTSSTGITVLTTGGQTWEPLSQFSRSPYNMARMFWCIFDGTWDVSPVFKATGATLPAFTMVMHVWRWPGTNPITLDVAEVTGNYAAPASPFDVTITGITTIRPNALVLAWWACGTNSGVARAWSLQTAEWANVGGAQYRNTGGNDQSESMAYLVPRLAGPTGDVTNRQDAASEGLRHIIAFSADAGGEPPPLTEGQLFPRPDGVATQ